MASRIIAKTCVKPAARGVSLLNPFNFPGRKMDGALRLRSCGKPPPVGAIAGFSCNSRRWPGRAADFHCARLKFSNVLRQCGARPGVVFHDFAPLQGRGIVGRAREYSHLRVLRQLHARSDLAVFTVPLKKVSWLPPRREKSVFIPVGANCPEAIHAGRDDSAKVKTVAVHSITGGDRTMIEVADLGAALQRAAKSAGPIRLVLFGRGSREAEPALRSELADAGVEIESLGLLKPEQVSQSLAGADVLLFVRGQISTRRGSAIAGIACGLPIVCYSGPETAWPITEAGILAVPLGDREALAAALETVLLDGSFRKTLAERSRQAQEKYFSWSAITDAYAAALGQAQTGQARSLTKESTGATLVA